MQADYDKQEYKSSNKYPKIIEIKKKAKKNNNFIIYQTEKIIY